MNFPAELLYTKDHEWIRINGDTATIGITDFAQKELGDIVFVEINAVGTAYDQNDVFGTIEAVKTVSELFIPVAGSITEINPILTDAPETVNQDPYGEGWMVKIQLNGSPDTSALLDANAYQEMIGNL